MYHSCPLQFEPDWAKCVVAVGQACKRERKKLKVNGFERHFDSSRVAFDCMNILCTYLLTLKQSTIALFFQLDFLVLR